MLILEGPGGKGDASTPLCLTSDAVKAMGFIIAGSIDSVRFVLKSFDIYVTIWYGNYITIYCFVMY